MEQWRSGDLASGELDQALLGVLVAARGRFVMNRTKAAKLLYLADLEMARLSGRTGSGATWRWRMHGPFDNELLGAEERLGHAGLIMVERTSNWYGNQEVRLEANESARPDVEIEFWEIVARIVDEYGDKAASTLKDIAYQTEPMLEAQANDEREGVLDLLGARPMPDVSASLTRLRQVLRRLGSQETDEGAQEEMASDIDALEPLRRRANQEMLD